MGRKNAKTTLLSAITLYCFLADNEKGADCYSVATKLDQSKIIFDECYNMITQNCALNKRVRKRRTDIYCPSTFSKIQPLSKNTNSLEGLNSHLVVIDECHSIKDNNLYSVMKLSQSSRTSPLLIEITTAGTVRESFYDEQYSYAEKIADNIITDEHYLPILYQLDSETEIEDEKLWIKANPNLYVSKEIEALRSNVNRAKQDLSLYSTVLCKDFDLPQTNSNSWLMWEQIENKSTYNTDDIFRNNYCIGGVDLSVTGDLTSASILTMRKDSDIKYLYTMCWIPEDGLDIKINTDKIPYDKWIKQGLVRTCKGNTINYSDVTQWYLEILNQLECSPLWIYYDSYSAKYFVTEMENNGFKMIRCIQGYKTLSLPFQQMGLDLKAHKINYNNNPVIKWCISNVGVEIDRNGNYLPKKALTATQRIDAFASSLDCYVGLMEHYNEFKEMVL